MKVEQTLCKNFQHLDYEFNKNFAKQYISKIEFGTEASATLEKADQPRYLMIEISKMMNMNGKIKKNKFCNPISLHQNSDSLTRKIENICKKLIKEGYCRLRNR